MEQRTRALFLVGGSAIGLILLAAGLHGIVLKPGLLLDLRFVWQPSASPGVRQTVDFPSWLPMVAAVGVVCAAIALVVWPSLRRDLMRNLPIYVLLLIGVFLMREAVVQNRAVPGATQPSVNQNTPQPAIFQQPKIPDFVNNPPEWLVSGLTLALAIGIIVAAWLLFRRIRKTPARLHPLDDLVEGARLVLADLQAGADLRDTITRCYAEMVRVINARRGVKRDVSMTPREFEVQLAASGLGTVHIQRLTRLFERVRYGPVALGPAEEHEAQACLQAIVEAYER